MKISNRGLYIDYLFTAKIYLNNFDILVHIMPMQYLLLFSLLNNNNNGFLLSSFSVSFVCGYIESIKLLLFSFSIGFANDGAKDNCFIGKIFLKL